MHRAVFFFVVVAGVFADHDHHKVQVEVFYESLCPDSIKFITMQLYPTLKTDMNEYINLQLVPFGKANQTLNNVNQYEFFCHHGPDECIGNRIQACAIEKGAPADALGTNRNTVGLISCLMEKVNRAEKPVNFPLLSCASENNILNVAEIQNCANHPDGVNYLAKMGNRTQQFQSPLRSVPTVVFNGAYSAEDSGLAQTDFRRAVCRYIRGEHMPAVCSAMRSAAISLLALLAMVFVYAS